MYIRKNVLPVNIISLNALKKVDIQIWITVQCRKLPAMIIGCMYRHPKASATVFEYKQDMFRLTSTKKRRS